MRPRWAAMIALISGVLPLAAMANDGGIAFGGSPGLLQGHPTVSMQSEIVRMTVGEEMVTVDCRFVFQNDGPACTVRMGFPDQGRGAEDPDEGTGEDWQARPPRATFSSFKSYVEGKPAATQLIRADAPGKFWHAKTVFFPANSRLNIRDVYTVRVGSQITETNSVVRQTSYILHTGASWHGPIGRTEIIVTFDRKRMTAPLQPTRVRLDEHVARVYAYDWSKQARRIFYLAPGKPTVSGKTLRFVRMNWQPTLHDDLYLYFDNLKAVRVPN